MRKVLDANGNFRTASIARFIVHGTGADLTNEIRADWQRLILELKASGGALGPVSKNEFAVFWKKVLSKLNWEFELEEIIAVAEGKHSLSGSSDTDLRWM